jgi:glucans biosynthesis protein C
MRKEPARSYELDWLRVAAVLVLVFFHTSEIFSRGWFHIKNAETGYFFNVLSSFIYIWHMPLFFLISGASTSFALEFRTGKQYRKERVYRLLIPLILGILFIIPPQSYFENLQKADFDGSYLDFYPHFFNGIYPEGNLHWGHLWFLFYLFVFSLVSSKLFTTLKSTDKKKLINQFANRFQRGHSIFLLAIPIIIIEIALRWLFSGFQTFITDWANVFHYLFLFILGFLIYSDLSLIDAVLNNKKKAICAAIPLSIGFLIVNPLSSSAFAGYNANPTLSYLIDHPETILYYILLMFFKVAAEWSWLIVFLGYSRKFLSNTSRGIKHLSKYTFPFYILHQTIVIAIGFYVVQLSFNIWSKSLVSSCLNFRHPQMWMV